MSPKTNGSEASVPNLSVGIWHWDDPGFINFETISAHLKSDQLGAQPERTPCTSAPNVGLLFPKENGKCNDKLGCRLGGPWRRGYHGNH